MSNLATRTFCPNCGHANSASAQHCVSCGHPLAGNPGEGKKKSTAIMLWLFFGVFGAHRFYLGDKARAMFMALFCGGFGFAALFLGVASGWESEVPAGMIKIAFLALLWISIDGWTLVFRGKDYFAKKG